MSEFWDKFWEDAQNTPAMKKAAAKQAAKDRIAENKTSGIACCPKCGSTSLSANKKGFGAGKAVAGAIIAGPLGLAAGGLGSGKVDVVCLSCGHKFKPGK